MRVQILCACVCARVFNLTPGHCPLRGSFVYVTAEGGGVFVFGGNEWGQLGLGHRNRVTEPTKLIGVCRRACVQRERVCVSECVYACVFCEK